MVSRSISTIGPLRRLAKILTSYPTIKVRNQSIYDIPEENHFDIAFSIGVIHHLAEPEAALRQLTRAVKPGGYVLIWVYGRENMNWLTRYFDPLRRWLLSRLALTARLSSFALPNSGLVVGTARGDVASGILQATSTFFLCAFACCCF